MAEFDILVTGGVLPDGVQADIGIKDGLIAAVGGLHADTRIGIWPVSPRTCAKLRSKKIENPAIIAKRTIMPVRPDRA